MEKQSATAVVVSVAQSRPANRKWVRPKRQPKYHVILWNDDDHSYDYVIRMVQELFGHGPQRGYEIARCVDRSGRAVCLTTTREHAELKQEQIHAYGKDKLISRCSGSMSSTIEPEV